MVSSNISFLNLPNSTRSGGWLLILHLCTCFLVVTLSFVYFLHMNTFPIKQRAPSSALYVGFCGTVLASYLVYVAETEKGSLSCATRLGEIPANFAWLIASWLRGIQLLVPYETNVYLYRNRRRKQESRGRVRPNFVVRQATVLGSHFNQAVMVVNLHLLSVCIWALLVFYFEVNCSNNTELWIRLIIVVAAAAPLGMVWMTRRHHRDPAWIFLEGKIDSWLAIIGTITMMLLQLFVEDKYYAECVLVFAIWSIIIWPTLGMPAWQAFIAKSRERRRSSLSTMDTVATSMENEKDSFEYDLNHLNALRQVDPDENTYNIKRNVPHVPSDLDEVLEDTYGALNEFLQVCREECTIESPEFLLRVNEFLMNYDLEIITETDRTLFNTEALLLYQLFLAKNSSFPINISGDMYAEMRDLMARPSLTTEDDNRRLDALKRVRAEIYMLVTDNSFKRFRTRKKKERKMFNSSKSSFTSR